MGRYCYAYHKNNVCQMTSAFQDSEFSGSWANVIQGIIFYPASPANHIKCLHIGQHWLSPAIQEYYSTTKGAAPAWKRSKVWARMEHDPCMNLDKPWTNLGQTSMLLQFACIQDGHSKFTLIEQMICTLNGWFQSLFQLWLQPFA